MDEIFLPDLESMAAFARDFMDKWHSGDIILLSGDLGVGKTTFVRCVLGELGRDGAVRSPTFNLMQIYETTPRVLHADLYRVKTAAGIGIEDFMDTHLCFIEWPDRLGDLVDPNQCWRIRFEFRTEGRAAFVRPPGES